MKESIFKFSKDFGRMGFLSGVFVAEQKDINDLIGKEVYFGEVLGKHSDIYCTLEQEDFQQLTDDKDFIEKFKNFQLSTGINPLHYTEE